MIKTHSDDPNVAEAASEATAIIATVLAQLQKADSFDYGGQILKIGEYDVCITCTQPIAEAQQAKDALTSKAQTIDDPVVKEHIVLAAGLFEHEAQAAIIRAELHNGFNTEPIVNTLLGYLHERAIHDDYSHSHTGKAQL